MTSNSIAFRMLSEEARALLTRLEQIKPFILHIPAVGAAMVSPVAQIAIERQLINVRQELRKQVQEYLRWLRGAMDRQAPAEEAQAKFAILRLRFNEVLTQFDIFSDALTQRSEHENGVWLSGLDAAAEDALALPEYYEAPPVVCYLDRGYGAAIRRARTRLPGGGTSPVAIIRVPRERMVGSGIASSLVHEVGHQGSVLLDLVNSLRPVLKDLQRSKSDEVAWQFWERWISEILADFWAVAKVGVAAILGLIGVVSLPRTFVFRIHLDDPHPFPYIRVKVNCAIAHALYPHRQWEELDRLWESLYPVTALDEERRRLITNLKATMPDFVNLLVTHQPKALLGKSLREAFSSEERQPPNLAMLYQMWKTSPASMRTVAPTLAFATIGQAKADGLMDAEEEGQIVSRLLTHWALTRSLNISAICATLPKAPVAVPVT